MKDVNMPPNPLSPSLDFLIGPMTWVLYIVAALSIVAAIVIITLVLVKRVQLEQLKAQLLKEATATDAAQAEVKLVTQGRPREEKKRASAELKDMNARLQTARGFVAMREREFSDYKGRLRNPALTLLVIGVAGFLAQVFLIHLQQVP